MPGVRYGPDISDDAAYVVDRVVALQEKLRRGLKLSKRESASLDGYASFATNLFGVKRRDFDKGKFGDMGEMALYGGSRSRSRLAKNWRTGQPMKKSVDAEFTDRGASSRRSGSSKTPDDAWYVGRTRSKGFRELEAKAQERLNKKGFKFGKTTVAKGSTNSDNFLAQVDRLNVARTQKGVSSVANRPRGGVNPATRQRGSGQVIRPSLSKSKQRAEQRGRAKKGTDAARDLAAKGKKGGSSKRKK
jgi:hypothetical protein